MVVGITSKGNVYFINGGTGIDESSKYWNAPGNEERSLSAGRLAAEQRLGNKGLAGRVAWCSFDHGAEPGKPSYLYAAGNGGIALVTLSKDRKFFQAKALGHLAGGPFTNLYVFRDRMYYVDQGDVRQFPPAMDGQVLRVPCCGPRWAC